MEQFIQDWGYWAVFLGSLVEGESVILTAGFLAHEGYLSLLNIILVAFVGTLIADQALFYVGRSYGMQVLDRFPKLRPKADKAFHFLHRYNTLYILSFRFIYGIRIISPIIIGASGIAIRRFTILNVISGAIWSVASCSAGYFFAHLVMGQMDVIGRYIAAAVAVLALIGWGVWKLWKRFHGDRV